MQHREKVVLLKICSEIDVVLRFLEGVTLENFLSNEILKRATDMTAINIGELTKNLSMKFRENYPQVAWKDAARFRDVIAHKHETLYMTDVYKTITEDFPEMKIQIEKNH